MQPAPYILTNHVTEHCINQPFVTLKYSRDISEKEKVHFNLQFEDSRYSSASRDPTVQCLLRLDMVETQTKSHCKPGREKQGRR